MPSTTKIHFGYIISILVAVIIALVTVKWSDIPTLANYLYFALGVASLVLAVVAIVYAFLANNSFNLTVAKLESAASAIQTETGILEKSVSGLAKRLNEVPEALQLIEGKVSRTHALLEASSQQHKGEPQNQSKSASIDEFAVNVIDHFFMSSSWNGLKVLHLCYLACEKKKEFDLKAWAE